MAGDAALGVFDGAVLYGGSGVAVVEVDVFPVAGVGVGIIGGEGDWLCGGSFCVECSIG